MRELCESFTALTGVAIGIMDLEGNILFASGWQEICLRFHRLHPNAGQNCLKNGSCLAHKPSGLEDSPFYRCDNGLMTCSFPIEINGSHIANFLSGQFLLEAPDRSVFQRRCRQFGFEEDAYLAALDRVPILSRDSIDRLAGFFASLVRYLGEVGLTQKRWEESLFSLFRSRRMLREVIDSMPQSIFWKDRESRYMGCNRSFTRVVGGKDPKEIIGKTDYDLNWSSEEAQRHREDDIRIMECNQPRLKLVEPLRQAEGRTGWIQMTKTPLVDEQGTVYGILGSFEDVTEKRTIDATMEFLAERNWRLSGEQFFSALARFLSEALDMEFIWISRLQDDGLTARTLALYRHGRFEDNIDYPLKDTPDGAVLEQRTCCIPRDFAVLFPDDRMPRAIRAESYVGIALQSSQGTGGAPIGLIAAIGEKPLTGPDLAESVLKIVAPRSAGELERIQAEERLRMSEEKFSTTFFKAPLMMSLSDLETGRYLDVNDNFLKSSGFLREEVIGKTSIELGWISAEDREQLIGTLRAEGRVAGRELELKSKSGTVRHSLYFGERITIAGKHCLLSMAEDITSRKKMEAEQEKLHAQLLQAQKMESIGRLAGGVAHDFNNMLSVILGHADLALEKMSPEDPFFADLTEIRRAAERSTDLTRQLLAFARKQIVVPRELDLNETVEGMLKMLRRLIGENIDLAWFPGKNIGHIRMDPSQLDQILANLCINSRDAIEKGGRVTIRTGRRLLDIAYCREHPDMVPGEYALLVVGDNGTGMNRDTLAKIFEPFFTTKEMGKGTGLGLAMVYGIVKQNSGSIEVQSEPGQGTEFTIYLPRHERPSVAAPRQASLQSNLLGKETVLLVEDDPTILRMTTSILERLGYRALPASTPEEALRVAQSHTGSIQLLMTDVVMPGMNGRDLAERLLLLHPDAKLLFMSGYTSDVIANQGVLDESTYFLPKPFALKDLALKLRSILDQDG